MTCSARASDSGGDSSQRCRHGDRGRLLRFDQVASHPTATDARAYLDAWIEFYQEFYHFPEDIPVDIDYGFDTWVQAMPRAVRWFRTRD